MNIGRVCTELDRWAPPSLQEPYDNSGLLIGEPSTVLSNVLVSLDITEEIIEEAIAENCNLIVAHHPLIFGILKRLTGKNFVERCVMKALRNNIAIYAIHTNLDNVQTGVNAKIGEKLELQNLRILQPKTDKLRKLITFVPETTENEEFIPDKVRNALFEAGAGNIGNYSDCSYNLKGFGTYRAGEGTNPYLGTKGELHKEEELKLEVIYPDYQETEILKALKKAHPYEEVAFDIFPLKNEFEQVGSGMIGNWESGKPVEEFLNFLKEKMNVEVVRYTPLAEKREIKNVAFCGGAGSFLLNRAKAARADAFITGDFKYHQFFDSEGKIMIADIGHYESEEFTIDLIHDYLVEKFSTFAVLKTKINTNPIRYI